MYKGTTVAILLDVRIRDLYRIFNCEKIVQILFPIVMFFPLKRRFLYNPI